MNVCILKMLYLDRFLNKPMFTKHANQKSAIFLYWYFLNKDFKFQPKVCNRYKNLLMISMSLCDVAILNIKKVDYHCIITRIKMGTLNVMQNADLTEKSRT